MLDINLSFDIKGIRIFRKKYGEYECGFVYDVMVIEYCIFEIWFGEINF